MYIFFSNRKKKDHFYIEGSEFKHLKIRRIRKGEEIGIIYSENLYLCIVEDIKPNSSLVRLLKKIDVQEPELKISLLQCVPQDIKTMDLIVQKAAEIGVISLTPVLSARSFPKIDVIKKRVERWKKISLEAMKQCARPKPMIIGQPIHLKYIESVDGLKILLHNAQDSKRIQELKLTSEKAYILTGPEGGFSEEEVQFIIDKGFIPVKIGPYILRSETASIVGCGLLINLASP